jgi:hypothetical protein
LKVIAILWLLAMTGTVLKYRHKARKRLKHKLYEQKTEEGKEACKANCKKCAARRSAAE